MSDFTKWVACWGNATSIANQTATTYTKNLTLRYPVRMCFDGSRLRFRFSNLTGTEAVTLRAFAARTQGYFTDGIVEGSSKPILVAGRQEFVLQPGEEVQSDELEFPVTAEEIISVSIFLPGYAQLNAGTLITGALSKGFYSYGDQSLMEHLPQDLTRNTNWFYFLNTIDVLTEESNHALICYGDSITAQDWPDELALLLAEKGIRNLSVIRRAVSGTRILRQYDCITYAAYGLKGEIRFPIEVNTAGADMIILQHGINDIIHPVGREVNVFRPMSDMPTLSDLTDGFSRFYVAPAKARGMKVYSGTLLPIYGWRTYADFREELKNSFNDWLRTNPAFDACIDFDQAVRDPAFPAAFAEGFDSGDHLHPSLAAYKAMAKAALDIIIK